MARTRRRSVGESESPVTASKPVKEVARTISVFRDKEHDFPAIVVGHTKAHGLVAVVFSFSGPVVRRNLLEMEDGVLVSPK